MTTKIEKILNRILIRGIVKQHYILNPKNRFNFNERDGKMEQTHYYTIDNTNLIRNISGPYDHFWENVYYNFKLNLKKNNNFDIKEFNKLFGIIYIKDVKNSYSFKRWN